MGPLRGKVLSLRLLSHFQYWCLIRKVVPPGFISSAASLPLPASFITQRPQNCHCRILHLPSFVSRYSRLHNFTFNTSTAAMSMSPASLTRQGPILLNCSGWVCQLVSRQDCPLRDVRRARTTFQVSTSYWSGEDNDVVRPT